MLKSAGCEHILDISVDVKGKHVCIERDVMALGYNEIVNVLK